MIVWMLLIIINGNPLLVKVSCCDKNRSFATTPLEQDPGLALPPFLQPRNVKKILMDVEQLNKNKYS